MYTLAKRAWNSSNPLYRWQMKHRKGNKSKTRHMSVVNPMARRAIRRYRASPRYRRARSSFLSTGNIFKYLRIGALVAPAVYGFMSWEKPADKANAILQSYTGFDLYSGQFNPQLLVRGWAPFIATTAITAGVSKINSMIRKF